MRRRSILQLAMLFSACSGAVAVPPAESLRLELGPAKRWLAPRVMILGFKVRNVGSEAASLSQHPGVAIWIDCLTKNGGSHGGGPGASSRDGDLAREYFLRLAPGEALMGEVAVSVAENCLSPVAVHGEYRADPDRRWGTGAREWRLSAAPLEVALPRPTDVRSPEP